MAALAGEILNEVSVALLTASEVDPDTTAPDSVVKAAAMVVVPGPTPVAVDPLMVATAVLDELHATWVVRLCVVPSLNLPVAKNDLLAPTPMVGVAGVT